MDVTYKYAVESPPASKEFKSFINDFFKNHFEEFMNNETLLMISPALGDNKTILQFDIDFKLEETKTPNTDATEVFKALNLAFKPFRFNMELTPNGCHIVSDFVYTRTTAMVNIKKQLSSYIELIKNLDLDASFNSVPLKRIGYDVKRHFFYAPASVSSNKFRTAYFLKKNPYDSEYWEDYIKNRLIPAKKNLDYMKMVKRLHNFSLIMKGETPDVIEEEE